MTTRSPWSRIATRPTDRGTRLDRFLQEALAPISRKRVKRILDDGRVRIEGRPARRAGLILTGVEMIEVQGIPNPEPPGRLTDAQLLHVDPTLVVVDKPAGLRMHAVDAEDSNHLVALVAQELQAREGMEAPPALHIVSRLDKETSGVVVLARSQTAAAALTEAFTRRRVHKVYRAVVHGRPPRDQGLVSAPIGPVGRGRFAVTRLGKPAHTRYQVLATDETMTHLRLHPETGRPHQIRVHLATIGTPIVGDLFYGGRRVEGVLRALLHAQSISLPHPNTGETVTFSAPLPVDLVLVLQQRGFDWA